MPPKILIIGYGHVGAGMRHVFPHATIHDPARNQEFIHPADQPVDLAVVCVPTARRGDGSCDTAIVREVVSQFDARYFLIKSTVTPGTCDEIAEDTGKRIVFSPEYMGESRYWTPAGFPHPLNPVGHGFVILGGEQRDCSAVTDMMLPTLGPCTRFRFMERKEAELVKYFENTFFALKVAFSNEMRRICQSSGINYHVVREGWLDDPRVGPMHSVAFADQPGFDGKCLPKDLSALMSYCRQIGCYSQLLEAVADSNRAARKEL